MFQPVSFYETSLKKIFMCTEWHLEFVDVVHSILEKNRCFKKNSLFSIAGKNNALELGVSFFDNVYVVSTAILCIFVFDFFLPKLTQFFFKGYLPLLGFRNVCHVSSTDTLFIVYVKTISFYRALFQPYYKVKLVHHSPSRYAKLKTVQALLFKYKD